MMKLLIASATFAALVSPALAQPPAEAPKPAPQVAAPKAPTEDVFTKADADKNGALTIAEVQKAEPKATQADFDKYDADKSSSLSKTEFQKWAQAKTTPPASAPGQ